MNDYLLFDLPMQTITKEITKFFKKSKSAHCARHTYTTGLVTDFLEHNIGPEYVRHITGHGEEEWRRYTHIILDNKDEVSKREFRDF